MKTTILKSALVISILCGTISGCDNGDDYSAPVLTCIDPNLTANKAVQDVVIFASTGTPSSPKLYTQDDIIEGYVTSSDEKGTFYKSVSMQTMPSIGTNPIGFSVSLNLTSSFARGFTPGKKVYIKLKGLYVAIVYGSLQIGELYQPIPTAVPEIGRVSDLRYENFIFPSCSEVSEDALVRSLTLAQAYSDNNLNTLIDLENIRFVDASVGRTYYDIDSGGGATNHFITPANGGGSQIIRFSSFAPFSGKTVPGGTGKIRGVLTKFDTDYQFIVRYESDIMLDTPRTFTFSGAYSENFESYSSNQNNFPNYINDPVIGSVVWSIKTSATKYIEMSSFRSEEVNRSLFFVPVDFTAANTFTFQYKVAFLSSGHVPLKVYYSKNYVPGSNISSATLVNITSQFSLLGTQSSQTFTSAGIYTLPENLTGNGFFIFDYSGSGIAPLQTTNLGIDNIVIN